MRFRRVEPPGSIASAKGTSRHVAPERGCARITTLDALNDAGTRRSARRRALAFLAVSTGGALSRPFRDLTISDMTAGPGLDGPERDEAVESFLRAVDGDRVRRLAEDYLDATRDPADADGLIARVLEDAEPNEGLGEYLLRIIAEDYGAQRTHDLDGWLVSRTEARLLAVLALTA